MRSVLPLLLVLTLTAHCAPRAAPLEPDVAGRVDPEAEYVRIQLESIERSPARSWVNYTDRGGDTQTATLISKVADGQGSWQATILDPSNPSVEPTVTVTLGPAAPELTSYREHAPVAVQDACLDLGSRPLACKVFLMADGRKKWMSAEVPLGGLAKMEGPMGEAWFTIGGYGAD